MFLRNVGGNSTGYTASYPSPVKTSNPTIEFVFVFLVNYF
jgi:hypothetical protein